MSDDMMTKSLHDEYAQRMADHHQRVDGRLDAIEKDIDEIREELRETREIAGDIRAINMNIEHMLNEQREQSERLKTLERQSLGAEVNRIEYKEDQLEGREASLEERVKALEQKPAKRWEALIGAIIAGIAGLLVGRMRG